MILYTNGNAVSLSGEGGIEMTPAHTYAMTTDFSKILDGLANGDIPCGSGIPFNVNWNETRGQKLPPWYDSRYPNGGFINPWTK